MCPLIRYNEVRANAGPDCSVVVVGNKIDQRHMRSVQNQDARNYAEQRNIQ